MFVGLKPFRSFGALLACLFLLCRLKRPIQSALPGTFLARSPICSYALTFSARTLLRRVLVHCDVLYLEPANSRLARNARS